MNEDSPSTHLVLIPQIKRKFQYFGYFSKFQCTKTSHLAGAALMRVPARLYSERPPRFFTAVTYIS